MIAYHFPPLAGSSGIQRTLRFVQHLPALGWQPLVLSAHPRAYEKTSSDLMADVPSGTVVRRAFALDTGRHLQVKGRYPGWMARPDRWVSWKFDAIRQGMKLIDEFKPEVIWSTYPIATAHVIASALHRKTGIPWLADFRDPMAQEGYPADPLIWQSFKDIEADAAEHASFLIFTTPGATRMYQQRYPLAASRMVVLENGYDEESFAFAELNPLSTADSTADYRNESHRRHRPLIMLHSGIVYPSERDPTQLFQAIAQLKKSGLLSAADLRIRFRAAVHDDLLQSLTQTYDVGDFIELCPAIPYRDALAEMLSVDALLIMQASNCNEQIPAKIYEYLRAGKPVLGLTDPEGDTAGVLRGAGLHDIARLDSVDDISRALKTFLTKMQQGIFTLPNPAVVQSASRRGRCESLVQLIKLADHK